MERDLTVTSWFSEATVLPSYLNEKLGDSTYFHNGLMI